MSQPFRCDRCNTEHRRMERCSPPSLADIACYTQHDMDAAMADARRAALVAAIDQLEDRAEVARHNSETTRDEGHAAMCREVGYAMVGEANKLRALLDDAARAPDEVTCPECHNVGPPSKPGDPFIHESSCSRPVPR